MEAAQQVPKAGRPATEDSPGAEVKRALAEWRLTPPHLREPQTVAALARKLGVSRSLLNYYDERTPQSPQEFIDACERGTLAKYYPESLDAIGRKAASGNVEAFKALAKTVVEPRRPQTGANPMQNIPTIVMNALVNMPVAKLPGAVFPSQQQTPGGKALPITGEKAALQIEAKSVQDSGETQNPVQLSAHVESTTYEKRALPWRWESADDIWNDVSLSQEQKAQAIAEFQRREYAKKTGRNE